MRPRRPPGWRGHWPAVELLVVLDNCEHVLEATAGLVATLLERCRRLRFLATSRERLDVPGELVFPVPPLGLPADGSAAAVAASEAGLLFAARAGAASPAFELSADNAAAVAQVCARLDGIPLAIELAAARCPALGPAELAARLDGHPGLLSGGPARPGRHRSLEALVSWSNDLLSEAEQRLLGRLSVLRGGFDLDMAERVAGGEPLAPEAIAGLLASLAGKSLVQIQAGVTVQYSLLETVRPRGASGPLHRDDHAPLGGAAVRHPGPARRGRNRGRVVLGRGTKRRGPPGGIPRPAGRGAPGRRPGRRRGRRRRAPPVSRRRAPRRDRLHGSYRPGCPSVRGRHRRRRSHGGGRRWRGARGTRRPPPGDHHRHARLRRGRPGLAQRRARQRRAPDPRGHHAMAPWQRPDGRQRRHRAPRRARRSPRAPQRRRPPARGRRRGPGAAAVPGPRIHRQPRRGRPRRQPGPERPRRGPLHPGIGRRPGTHAR